MRCYSAHDLCSLFAACVPTRNCVIEQTCMYGNITRFNRISFSFHIPSSPGLWSGYYIVYTFCEVSVVAYEIYSLLIFAAYKLYNSIIYYGLINFTTEECF